MKAQADMVHAAADNIRAQIEAETQMEQKASVPTLEELAQLIIQSRQPLNGMTITAPSGGIYGVKLQ